MDVVCGFLDENRAVFDPDTTTDAVMKICSSKRARRAAWASPSCPSRPAILLSVFPFDPAIVLVRVVSAVLVAGFPLASSAPGARTRFARSKRTVDGRLRQKHGPDWQWKQEWSWPEDS